MESLVLRVPALAPLPTVTDAVTEGEGQGGVAAPERTPLAVPPGETPADQAAVQTVVRALPGSGAATTARNPSKGST